MNGKNRHDLLITPKPDKRPRIIVPRSMSLDNVPVIVVVSDEAKAAHVIPDTGSSRTEYYY
jgi:hypothetical protein